MTEKSTGLKVNVPNRTLSAVNRDAVQQYKMATKAPVSKEEKLLEEFEGFTSSFQMLLKGKEAYDSLYADPTSFLDHCRSGVILSEVINAIMPNSLDMKKVNKDIKIDTIGKQGSKDIYLVTENLNEIIKTAKKLGCKIVNTGAEDIVGKNEDITLGLVWQIVRMGLVKDVNLLSHPELVRLLHENEQLTDLIALSPEALLLRWLNHHLMRAGVEQRVKKFDTDLKDSVIYSIILERIAPRLINKDALDKAMAQDDLSVRAVEIINQVNQIGCETFVRPVNVISGHKKFNTALVASMFTKHIGIHLPSEDELDQLFAKLELQAEEILILKKKLAHAVAEGVKLESDKENLQREKEEAVSALQTDLATLTEQYQQAVIAAEKAKELMVQTHETQVAELQKMASEKNKEFEAQLANEQARAEKERLAKLAVMAGAEESAEAAEQLRKAEEEAKEKERLAKEEEQVQKKDLQDMLKQTRKQLRDAEQMYEETLAKFEKEKAAKCNEEKLKESTQEQLARTKDTLAKTTTSLQERRGDIDAINSEIDDVSRIIVSGLGDKADVGDLKGTDKLRKLLEQLLKCNKENERKKHEALSKYAAEQSKNDVILTKTYEQITLKAASDRQNQEDEDARKNKKWFGGIIEKVKKDKP